MENDKIGTEGTCSSCNQVKYIAAVDPKSSRLWCAECWEDRRQSEKEKP